MKNEKNESEQLNKKRGNIVFIFVCVAILTAFAALLWFLSGAGRTPDKTVAFSVGGDDVYMDEVNLYCLENMVNLNISNRDLENNTATDGTPAPDYYKQEILELIRDNKVAYRKAVADGMELSEEEATALRADVTEYMGRIKGSILNGFGITQETIYNSYMERFIANKRLQQERDTVEVESQRYCTIYMLMFPKIEVDEAGDIVKDDDGNAVLLPDTELEKRKRDADEAYASLKDGADIEELAKRYGVEKYSGQQSNLEDSFGEELGRYVKTLKQGQYSPVLDLNSSYAILEMKEEDNSELAEQILSYYRADMEKEAVRNAVDTWYDELGISREEDTTTSAWRKLSLFDFTKYAEE